MSTGTTPLTLRRGARRRPDRLGRREPDERVLIRQAHGLVEDYSLMQSIAMKTSARNQFGGTVRLSARNQLAATAVFKASSVILGVAA